MRRCFPRFLQNTPINPSVLAAEYAVRGLIPTRAGEIEAEIASGKDNHPFQKLVYCNIGNPQSLKQKPLTFNRQVMSLIDAPFLLDNPKVVAEFPADAVARAREYLTHIGSGTGAYTGSFGYDFARRVVAKHIDQRDKGIAPLADPANIVLTDGASTGVKLMLQALVGGPRDGVMIPIPQYPLYTAQIALLNGKVAPYYLKESEGWKVSADDLEAAYRECVEKEGATPRLFVAINPGNPTGNVMDRASMEDVVRFCHNKGMLLLADEVYQENIYAEGKEFVSFREALLGLPEPYRSETMLVSLHSTSKGIIGECGRRGGYFEMLNLPSDLHTQIVKLCSVNLCANVNGQVMTTLMCSPPQKGDASYESFREEYNTILNSLKSRALLLAKELNTIPGFSCQPVEGAMYAFPQIKLPEKYVAHNDEANAKEKRRLELDARWALELLEATGIVVVPGSGFGQEKGTLHFRTTILPPMDQMEHMVKSIRSFQEGVYAKYA
uniref:Alanine transaminase n=1 Tax=Herpetomonas muscarum TaxID=5718 RepID=U5KMR5_HERMU|nr:alanine transaminase [Herpetomonas muscarum]